jgi:hypothetical protein
MKPQWRQVGCTPAPYVNRPRETGADFFEVHMAAIMPMDEPRPHGSVIGERVGGAPLGEGENFFKCDSAAAGLMPAIWLGLRIIRPRCRILRWIGCSNKISVENASMPP